MRLIGKSRTFLKRKYTEYPFATPSAWAALPAVCLPFKRILSARLPLPPRTFCERRKTAGLDPRQPRR